MITAYKERKEEIGKIVAEYDINPREEVATGVTLVLQANIAWALLDIAESLDNIRQNGVQVETFASAHQPF